MEKDNTSPAFNQIAFFEIKFDEFVSHGASETKTKTPFIFTLILTWVLPFVLFVQAFSVIVFMDSIFQVLFVGTVKVDGAFTVNDPLLPE